MRISLFTPFCKEPGELLDNFKRGGDDRGFGRHIAAILASKDRLDKVSNINVPTLIIHGEDDPLIRVKNAKASHRLIKNSKLKLSNSKTKSKKGNLINYIGNVFLKYLLVKF